MSKNIVRTGIVSVVGIALSACMSEIDSARNLETDTGDYRSELAAGYRQLAIYEADEMYDWLDARTFAQKAIGAANNLPIDPENPSDWNLNDEVRTEVESAHASLVAALSTDFAGRSPSSAAMAQISFDCWVEQLEEGWQLDHIASCKARFDAAMEDAAEGTPPSHAPVATQQTIDPEFAEFEATDDGSTSRCGEDQGMHLQNPQYTIHFLHDDSAIGEQDLVLLGDLASQVNVGGMESLLISGHADTSGANDYNLELSFERATNVWRALLEKGVSPTRMWISAHGEFTAEFETADGERDQRNRRVMIEIDHLSLENDSPDCIEITSKSF